METFVSTKPNTDIIKFHFETYPLQIQKIHYIYLNPVCLKHLIENFSFS